MTFLLPSVHGGHTSAGGIGGNDANTLLLLRPDGADESQTFIDASSYNRTPSVTGNVKCDNGQTKFTDPTMSISFDGNNDVITFPDSTDWDFGTGDWTYDWWEYRQTMSTGEVACAMGTNKWYLPISSSNMNITGGPGNMSFTQTLNQWVHYAVQRSGNNWCVWVDGVVQSTATNSNAQDSNAGPRFGQSIQYGTSTAYDGWMDEFRISDIARYTHNTAFTPPTERYSA